MSKVRDQGYCGSCWAFATTQQYESLARLKGISFSDLSVDATLECTDNYWGMNGQNGCQGGIPAYANGFLAARGLPLESSYPYASYYWSSPGFKSTPKVCTETNRRLVPLATSSASYTALTVNQIKTLLTTHGPLTIALYAGYSSFSYYKSGTYAACSYYTSYTYAYNANHAMVLYGWDSKNNWLIRNSWGTSWGNSGNMVLSSTYDCGMRYYITYVKSTYKSSSTVLSVLSAERAISLLFVLLALLMFN